jgi:hypothetical protein
LLTTAESPNPPVNLNIIATCSGCQRDRPLDVRTPRAVSADAIARSDVAPERMIWSTIGLTFSALSFSAGSFDRSLIGGLKHGRRREWKSAALLPS